MSGSDLYTGTLELLILRTIAGGPLHGYAVGRWIRETSGEILQVEEGALYPALHRLEKRGLISSEWSRTERGRRAKFYTLTEEGSRHLESEARRWDEHSSAVETVLRTERS